VASKGWRVIAINFPISIRDEVLIAERLSDTTFEIAFHLDTIQAGGEPNRRHYSMRNSAPLTVDEISQAHNLCSTKVQYTLIWPTRAFPGHSGPMPSNSS